MAFRHFFAHAYAFEFCPDRIQPLVDDVDNTYAKFKAEADRAISA